MDRGEEETADYLESLFRVSFFGSNRHFYFPAQLAEATVRPPTTFWTSRGHRCLAFSVVKVQHRLSRENKRPRPRGRVALRLVGVVIADGFSPSDGGTSWDVCIRDGYRTKSRPINEHSHQYV